MELKAKMTFEEMARHMEENTYRIANRVNVGRYARFYINDALATEKHRNDTW